MPLKSMNKLQLIKYGKNSQGFTMVELIISMAIGTIVIAGALNIFVTNTKASSSVLETTHLNQEIRTTMEIMRDDIQKSGYWANAKNVTALTPNPFGISFINAAKNCILFSYDANDDTALNSPDEQYGFRLNGGNIEYRVNGTDCSTANTWTSFSDNPQVEITSFIISSKTKCTNISNSPITNCTVGDLDYIAPVTSNVLVENWQVSLSLAGRLIAKPEVILSIDDSIIIKNDSIKLAP